MSPTYQPGEGLLIRRWRIPQRWDTVVVRSPTDANRLIVKRVVGLPGENLRFTAGKVFANGELKTPKTTDHVHYGAQGAPDWQLGPEEWFLAGDNQIVSVDSRNWLHTAGLPTRLIVGVVVE